MDIAVSPGRLSTSYCFFAASSSPFAFFALLFSKIGITLWPPFSRWRRVLKSVSVTTFCLTIVLIFYFAPRIATREEVAWIIIHLMKKELQVNLPPLLLKMTFSTLGTSPRRRRLPLPLKQQHRQSWG